MKINNKVNRRSINYTVDDLIMAIIAIVGMGIDVTMGCDKDLFRIGYLIASNFGEKGRRDFHNISSQRANYDTNSTNKLYDKCLNSIGRYTITINSFFYKINQIFYERTGMSFNGFVRFVHS